MKHSPPRSPSRIRTRPARTSIGVQRQATALSSLVEHAENNHVRRSSSKWLRWAERIVAIGASPAESRLGPAWGRPSAPAAAERAASVGTPTHRARLARGPALHGGEVEDREVPGLEGDPANGSPRAQALKDR